MRPTRPLLGRPGCVPPLHRALSALAPLGARPVRLQSGTQRRPAWATRSRESKSASRINTRPLQLGSRQLEQHLSVYRAGMRTHIHAAMLSIMRCSGCHNAQSVHHAACMHVPCAHPSQCPKRPIRTQVIIHTLPDACSPPPLVIWQLLVLVLM